MSQIQITGEAKIRSLNGALTATSGIVNSVPLGGANGVATLGGDGKVPSSQLPSYVDDVVEVPTYADLPVVGESGKIYVTLDTNKIYRWTGSTYVEIVDSTAVWGAITGTLSNQTDLQNALNAKVPYTGATSDVNLGSFDLKTAKLLLLDEVETGYGSIHLADNSMHFEDAHGHTMFLVEDGFIQIHKDASIQSNVLVSNLTATRDHYLPNESGTLALTSDISYPVTSVFGRTGAIAALSGDYNTDLVTEGTTNLYFTNARSRSALSFASGSGAYNSTTGVITIPTNTNQLTNGASFITLGSLSAGAGISYNNTTGVIISTITQYTDALARASISLTTTGTSGAATYNSTTGVLNIPNYVGGITSVSGTSPISVSTVSGAATVSIATANTTTTGALTSTDWNTFNGKQAALNGTGFVKIIGTTISYDNSTYLTTSAASSTYLPLAGGTLTGALSGTSATFSGQIAIGGQSNIYGGLAGLYAIQNGNSSYYSFDQESGIVGNAYYNGGWKYKTTNRASRYIANIGTHTFEYAASGTANAVLTWLPALTIASTGAATFSSSVTAANYKAYLGGLSALRTYTKDAVVELVSYQSVSGYPYTKTTDLVANADSGAESQFRILTAEVGGNPTTRLFVSPSGNVGIGITAPNARLSLGRASYAALSTPSLLVYDGGFTANGGNGFFAGFSIDQPNNGDFNMIATHTGSIVFSRYTNASDTSTLTERMRITSGGNVLIGTTTDAGYKLYVSGTVASTGGFFDTSDRRLKKEIVNNPQVLDIESIKPKLYVKSDKEELGYYAQDLQEILPSAVTEGNDGFLSLSYSQVHTAKIAYLENEVAELKELIKKLL